MRAVLASIHLSLVRYKVSLRNTNLLPMYTKWYKTFLQALIKFTYGLSICRNYIDFWPLGITHFSFFQTCVFSLVCCLIFSATLYALIVVPPGGFHFNINGLLVCEPYFISNNILALAACLFYFPTTMILMYCYG